jgi:hypothetical protein
LCCYSHHAHFVGRADRRVNRLKQDPHVTAVLCPIACVENHGDDTVPGRQLNKAVDREAYGRLLKAYEG